MSGSVTTWSAEGPLLPGNLDFKKLFVRDDEIIRLIASNGIHVIGTLKEIRDYLRGGEGDSICYRVLMTPFQAVFYAEMLEYPETLFVATKNKFGFVGNYHGPGKPDTRVVSECFPPESQSDMKIPNNVRYTGGSVDCKGRVWLMTYDGKNSSGQLFHLDKNWKPANPRYVCGRRFGGICWSLDDKTIYIHETARNNCVLAYDFDIETGIIRMDKDRLFYEFENPTEYPMAFMVDSQDHMWCAVAGTSRIIRISPKSEVVGEINLPSPHEPIDLQFSGNELVILTKRNIKSDEVLPTSGTSHEVVKTTKEAPHGNIFTVDIGYTGKPIRFYKLGPEELCLLKNSGLSLGEQYINFLRKHWDVIRKIPENKISRGI